MNTIFYYVFVAARRAITKSCFINCWQTENVFIPMAIADSRQPALASRIDHVTEPPRGDTNCIRLDLGQTIKFIFVATEQSSD